MAAVSSPVGLAHQLQGGPQGRGFGHRRGGSTAAARGSLLQPAAWHARPSPGLRRPWRLQNLASCRPMGGDAAAWRSGPPHGTLGPLNSRQADTARLRQNGTLAGSGLRAGGAPDAHCCRSRRPRRPLHCRPCAGHVKRVRCESSAAMVPKDKAIKRFIVRNMVDASAIRDLQDACAIDGGCCARASGGCYKSLRARPALGAVHLQGLCGCCGMGRRTAWTGLQGAASWAAWRGTHEEA